MRELLAATGEPPIPAVGKYLDRAKELSIHELTQANK